MAKWPEDTLLNNKLREFRGQRGGSCIMVRLDSKITCRRYMATPAFRF